MTLSSRHRIRNSSPGGLRPSSLPLGHGGSPQYCVSHVDGEDTFLLLPNRRDREPNPNSSAKDSGANHYPKPCVCVKLGLVGSWDFAYCWHNVRSSVDSGFICWQLLQSQKKRHVDPMLSQCWSTVFYAGQHWSSIGSMCCVGCSFSQTAEWVRQCIYRDGLMAASRLLYQGCWTKKYSGTTGGVPIAVLVLAQRRGRWADTKTALVDCLRGVGYCSSISWRGEYESSQICSLMMAKCKTWYMILPMDRVQSTISQPMILWNTVTSLETLLNGY